jgi:CDP-4-dehydro-6-deoxyglucose reductase, E1
MNMKIYYAEANYEAEEIEAVMQVLSTARHSLMDGKEVRNVEAKIAKLFRKTNSLMVNSGSSANLLAVKGLKLQPGSRVITPALTFSTTVSPLVHSDLRPLFVDCDINTLQIDDSIFGSLDLTDVSAICVPNLIGNLPNWKKIKEFASQNNLKVIEDSADTIGYRYSALEEDWSDASTTSFYASHVLTGAGFGGAVAFKSEDDYNFAKSLRGWGRRSSQYGETEDANRRFNCVIDGINYDDKYVFDDLGFNFLPSEVSAAFVRVQLDNLEKNIQHRYENYKYLCEQLQGLSGIRVMKMHPSVFAGLLAFPILFTGKYKQKRTSIQRYLEDMGVQTRTVFTGNITRQPVAKKFDWDSFGKLDNSDYVMENGILLGCHNRMNKLKLDYMLESLHTALKKVA